MSYSSVQIKELTYTRGTFVLLTEKVQNRDRLSYKERSHLYVQIAYVLYIHLLNLTTIK